MEQQSGELKNQESAARPEHKRHHRRHKHSSENKISRHTIYRNILLIAGFTMIIFSVSEESIALALSGSITLLLSLAFTDFYRRSFRSLNHLFSSLTKNDENEHKHKRHHRHH